MEIDRRSFLTTLGGAAAIETMSSEALADALEHRMMEELDAAALQSAPSPASPVEPIEARRGAGSLFLPSRDGETRRMMPLSAMPDRPTILDFFTHRFAPATHVLQSATDALKKGQKEETILACLLHDVVLNLIKVDHGWWGAQLVEPYVSEKVAWAIRYHQCLRFYPDQSVGYEYPEMYNRIFGKDYVPQPHIKEAYEYARKHRWYMEARLVTVHDQYAFNKDMVVSIEPFIDIIGRHFKQPKEGLGSDGSPVAHMWRTMIYPDNPL